MRPKPSGVWAGPGAFLFVSVPCPSLCLRPPSRDPGTDRLSAWRPLALPRERGQTAGGHGGSSGGKDGGEEAACPRG